MEAAGTVRASTAESDRAERWWGVRVDEGEMGEIFLCSISRGDKALTTWGSGHRRRTVTVMSPHVVLRACPGDRHEPFKQPLRLTSGPQHFSDFLRFSIFQTLKSKSVTFPLSKLHQFLWVEQLETQGATFFFGTTSNSLRISSYNF
jgi:hypothetical protein